MRRHKSHFTLKKGMTYQGDITTAKQKCSEHRCAWSPEADTITNAQTDASTKKWRFCENVNKMQYLFYQKFNQDKTPLKCVLKKQHDRNTNSFRDNTSQNPKMVSRQHFLLGIAFCFLAACCFKADKFRNVRPSSDLSE